jgi:hypothetical protein
VNQKHKIIILYLITLPLLFLARIYLLNDTGMFDYDSVKNFMVAKEIAEGNFINLFHHVSPTFNLLYALLYKVVKNYLLLEYADALLNVFAVALFVHFIFIQFKLNLFQTWLILMLSGLSFFMVGSSRYFGIESLSLLLFVLTIIYYAKNLQNGDDKNLYKAVFFYAMLMTVNRKFIVFIFIVIAIEVLQKNRKLKSGNIFRCIGIILIPLIVYPLIGYLFGLRLLQYYASIFYMLFQIQGNPTHYSTFNWDLSYYLKYFLYYENPVLIIVLVLFPILYRKELFSNMRNINLYQFLFIITYCFLAGMSVINKAPRGLLGIYLPLYFFLFLCLDKIFRNRLALGFMALLIISAELYLINKNIYQYSQTNYNKVAKYIEENKIKKLVTTVGINIIPFLKEDVEVKMIFDEKELDDLQKQGFQYVLLDDFHYLTYINQFDKLHKHKPVFQVKEPSLLAPLMALESSEYSSIGFEETMKLREVVEKDQYQLRLIDLRK